MRDTKYIDSYLEYIAIAYKEDKSKHMRMITDENLNVYDNSFTISELCSEAAKEIRRLREENAEYEKIRRLLELVGKESEEE